jgi:hypothetical protein
MQTNKGVLFQARLTPVQQTKLHAFLSSPQNLIKPSPGYAIDTSIAMSGRSQRIAEMFYSDQQTNPHVTVRVSLTYFTWNLLAQESHYCKTPMGPICKLIGILRGDEEFAH